MTCYRLEADIDGGKRLRGLEEREEGSKNVDLAGKVG